MNGAVQVFPNQCVMFHVFDEVILGDISHSEILDSIHGHNSNIFNGSQEIFEGDKISVKITNVCMYVCILTYIIKCLNTSFQDIYSHSFPYLSKLLLNT